VILTTEQKRALIELGRAYDNLSAVWGEEWDGTENFGGVLNSMGLLPTLSLDEAGAEMRHLVNLLEKPHAASHALNKCPNDCKIDHVLVCGSHGNETTLEDENVLICMTLQGVIQNRFADGSTNVPDSYIIHAKTCHVTPICPECLSKCEPLIPFYSLT
jgi:hypothetical protein